MRTHLKLLLSFTTGCLVCGESIAIVPEPSPNRFQTIAERNAFRLKPAELPHGPAQPAARLPKLILTGITTILGNKLALMKLLPTIPAPAPAAKEESLILTEGQREGAVEVLTIDENAGSVKVNNSGSVMTLTFEKDGAKLPATPAPAASPYGSSARVPIAAVGFGVSTNAPAVPVNGFAHPVSGRIPRMAVPAAPAPPALPGAASAAAPPLPGPASSSAAPAQPGLTAQEQAIILQLQQESSNHNLNPNPNTQTPIASPQIAPAPGTPAAGIPTVVPPGFKTPSTVGPATSPQQQMPQ